VFRPKLEVLPPAQRALWDRLSFVPRDFVLYGGTAMALRLGHRQSVDFDFFRDKSFQAEALMLSMKLPRETRVDRRGESTLSVVIDDVRISFFGDVGMSRIYDPEPAENAVNVAALLDLAATKLKTIQQRAEAKDYQDLAAALGTGIKLEEALAAAGAVFGRRFNAIATLKALMYFEDGDLQALPAIVKDGLRTAASAIDIDSLPSLTGTSGVIAQHGLP